jgi:deoxyribose-phosphate aldolase
MYMSVNLASYIDHTLLKESAGIEDLERICREAIAENFAAVCIRPKYIAEARIYLAGYDIKIAAVIAFPLGEGDIETKVAEIKEALNAGADEIDMVADICSIKSGNWRYVEQEIKACLEPVTEAGKVIKVIVESGILTDDELAECCRLYGKYPINYMKTSSGYSDFGATLHAVTLMNAHLPAHIGIKASGGIRTYEFAKALLEAGATRLGCSTGVQIIKEYREFSSGTGAAATGMAAFLETIVANKKAAGEEINAARKELTN